MQAIGPGTTLAPAPDTTAMAIDDEQFVVNTARAAVHRLTGTAATVWQVLDGTASLDVLAGELAEVYSAEPSVVLDDLERLGSQLAALGLVRDIDHVPVTTTRHIPADKEPVPDPRYIAVPPST